MRTRLSVFVIMCVVLAAAGLGLGRVVAPVWNDARTRQPAMRLDSTVAAAGQGVTLALLGGFRALVGDAAWIRMYVQWEKRDLPGTQSLIQLVTALDPRPLYFWINGARILANDLTAWRVESAGGHEAVGAAGEQRIEREQGDMALRQLAAARAFHPMSPDLWIERANIELNRLHDGEAAAESYRRAWEQPGAPYFAARLYAEVLRRLGRKTEALAWLVKLHPTLPRGDESAGEQLVLARIRDLERELGVPPEQRYQPSRP